ncbi:MAG: hypothetical protein QM626_06815 [Microbacterium sp.]
MPIDTASGLASLIQQGLVTLPSRRGEPLPARVTASRTVSDLVADQRR